ncbi:MAG TPA: GSCFA domain-containing protein [Blastocatellia bacterium]|nr:GSCFA domain-containing protein [Blastocatellia bacterium]
MDAWKKELLEWPVDRQSTIPEMADRWYKGEHCHRLASKPQVRANPAEAVLFGWLPEKPIISPETRVMALGNCFARNFVLWLGDHGFNLNIPQSPYNSLLRYSSGLENAAVIAQQFRWAFDEFDPGRTLWVDKDKQLVNVTEQQRETVRESLRQTDVLLVVLGSSEAWYDKITNEPLWRAIPVKYYDPERHVFRVESFANTMRAFEQIDELRGRHLPALKLIFMVSPGKFAATFRPVSAITANSASKAIVRAALDEFLRHRWEQVNQRYFYFPSYELAMDCFDSPLAEDNRHLYDYAAAGMTTLFARHYTTFEAGDGALATPPAHPNEELLSVIAELENRNKSLQRVCDERLRVIEELDQAARERLEVIRRLESDCQVHLKLLGQLPGGELQTK